MWRFWQRVAAPFEVTDDEHVERIRRAVALYDRRRWLLLAFYLVLTVGLVGVVITALSLFQGLLQGRMGQGAGLGFLIGLMLGAQLGGLIGILAHLLVYGLATFFTAMRTERLLLRYYDVLAELAKHAGPDSEDTPARSVTEPYLSAESGAESGTRLH